MHKRSSTTQAPSLFTRLMRAGMAGCLMLAAALPIGTGCLNRPVGEQAPQTTNIFVEQFINSVIDKIDLLFMIDNSISMADKQAFFAEAVPILVNRLINPICVSESNPNDTQAGPAGGGACPAGYQREFDAIRDIHIGIVSSSLGSFGGVGASACVEPEKNDHAQLIGAVRNLPSFNGLGFLAWDPDNLYGGTTQADALVADFTTMVTATGEQGCGYEASLEAWYRFLIDPLPYASLVQPQPGGPALPATDDAGNMLLDGALLQQRQAFLRPDSLVAVVMLTDENDCSVAVPGFGWLVTLGDQTLPRATSQCASNPNDRCCRSCGSKDPACGDDPNAMTANDPNCAQGSYTREQDPPNLRCFRQKQRFGIDLLFPTARYAVGLKSPQLCPGSPYGDMDCSCDFARNVLRNNDCNVGAPVLNPLYTNLETGELATRDPSLVYFAAIVGVPWQDIATEDSLGSPDTLRYMTFNELTAAGRWADIVGDIYNNVAPGDPFMHESIEPRGGQNPITGTAITAVAAGFNDINGHEYNVLQADDLQYACIFPLGDKQRDCDAVPEGTGCDCDAMEMVDQAQNPLCAAPGGGFTALQTSAKGYPGLRHLDALQRFGGNSIVASICPKVVQPANPANPNYGYNPAVSAIIDRLKEALGGRCLPRKLVPENAEDELYEQFAPGQVPCRIVEAVRPHPTNGCAAPDSIAGREDTRQDPALDKAVRDELRRSMTCDATGTTSCAEMCLFTIQQTVGDQQTTCQTVEGEVTNFEGYCYIDPLPPEQGGASVGNENLVADCPASQKRLLRFVGTNTPQNNAITFIACSGAAVSQL